MPGMLGNHQDFQGEGEHHPRIGENWGPYRYSMMTDPFYFSGDPHYRGGNGANPSNCPEMKCGPPNLVVASVSGFSSQTRVAEGEIQDWMGVLKERWKSADAYAFRDPSWMDFEAFANVCGLSRPSGPVLGLIARRWPSPVFDFIAVTQANNILYQILDEECEKDKELSVWGGLWASIAYNLGVYLWPNNGFNGGVPYTSNGILTGQVGGGRTLINNEKIDLEFSSMLGFTRGYTNNIIHFTKPNFFNVRNKYNGIAYTSRLYTWGEIASEPTLAKVLNAPSNDYSSLAYIQGAMYDNDHNGTYICHRSTEMSLRPELIAKINKTKTHLTDEAELIYEVGCREKWFTGSGRCQGGLQIGFDCTNGEPIDPDPFKPQYEGQWYGVDYSCGFRRALVNYLDKNDLPSGSECSAYRCENNVGNAKPHLETYPFGHNNVSSRLKLNIQPYQWMHIHGSVGTPNVGHDELGAPINYLNPGNQSRDISAMRDPNATPFSWIVTGAEILKPGRNYKVGDFFYIDFDPAWFLPWVNGQIITIFPDLEYCDPGGQTRLPISWTDDYGYIKRKGRDIVYQRLRVSEIDNEGGIVSLEVVPWYKSPEWKRGKAYRDMESGDTIWSNCQTTVQNKKDKTKFYVEYSRFLCHPNSVRNPGQGYSVGDTITWDFPSENRSAKGSISDTWKGQKAVAVVVDVDENGGILDWYISGSDRWKQYGVLNLTDGAPCYQYANEMVYYDPVLQTLERDDRGRYRFIGYPLCTLNYEGIGVPVRSTDVVSGANTSNLTSLNISVIRENCKTTAGIELRPWPFSLSRLCLYNDSLENGCFVQYKDLWYYRNFPPYPQCFGGGLEIQILFGSERANDSVFGSTITGAKIVSRGSGYAYKEKKHVEPNLLKQVPDIASLDLEGQELLDESDEAYTNENDNALMAQGVGFVGSGAEISFNFKSIHNFPNPEVLESYRNNKNNPYFETYDISSDRFSYFPVISVSVSKPGKGYKIGQRFDVWPVGRDDGEGGGVVDFWSRDGGDDPELDGDGSWYSGIQVDNRGYMIYLPQGPGPYKGIRPVFPKQPQCTLEISKINPEGGIESIKVIEGGTMFKPVWTTGKKHPDSRVFLTSSLGYGAVAEAEINTNINDKENFSSVSKFRFRGATVDELPDPYYPYSELKDRKKIPTNGGFGRDYANPEHGYYWRLENTTIGAGVYPCRLLAYYDWGLPQPLGDRGNVSTGIRSTPLNYFPAYETHKVIKGSRPPFVPMTTVCSFQECYHDLLNKTYPIYRTYSSIGRYDPFNCGAVTTPFTSDGVYLDTPPKTGYCVAMRKIRLLTNVLGSNSSVVQVALQPYVYSKGSCDGDIHLQSDGENLKVIKSMGPSRLDTAGQSPEFSTSTGAIFNRPLTPVFDDYHVVEYSMRLSLSSVSTIFDHTNGRTTEDPLLQQRPQ